MTKITTLFWDVGGVLLTNAWDRSSRRKAVERFRLEGEEFEDRHERVNGDFEKGKLTLDEYLDQTIFYRKRSFSKTSFKTFMFAQSQPNLESLALMEQIAAGGGYSIHALNNESRELNEDRIRRFGLDRFFDVFLSSCFLGLRKPDEAMFRLALEVTHRSPEETLLIDDRLLNLEGAGRVSMNTLRFINAAQTEKELKKRGIEW
ncbi:MAG: HAD family phosphatase [Elusimicrobia bacterium]|nr:HAD family phosphatase [Elusimicrobiota bacterium]